MFEKVKKAIRRGITAKKRLEVEKAMPIFQWHFYHRIDKDDPWVGTGEITYRDWHWFKQLIEDGIVFDYKVEKCYRACGHIVYKDVEYKFYDWEALEKAFDEHNFNTHNRHRV